MMRALMTMKTKDDELHLLSPPANKDDGKNKKNFASYHLYHYALTWPVSSSTSPCVSTSKHSYFHTTPSVCPFHSTIGQPCINLPFSYPPWPSSTNCYSTSPIELCMHIPYCTNITRFIMNTNKIRYWRLNISILWILYLPYRVRL